METSKYAIGETVTVDFLGTMYEVIISDLKKNPQNTNRWIYSGTDVKSGLKLSYIGVNGSEQFANIVTPNNVTNSEE